MPVKLTAEATPEFEASLATACGECAATKKQVEALSASSRAAAKALAARVDAPAGRLSGLLVRVVLSFVVSAALSSSAASLPTFASAHARRAQGSLGSGTAAQRALPPVEAFLADALVSVGAGDDTTDGPLSALLGSHVVAPLGDTLRSLGAARLVLANSVLRSTTGRLDAFADAELAAVAAEAARAAKAKTAADAARAEYLRLGRGADRDARAGPARRFDDARSAARAARSAAARAVAAAEAKRRTVVLDGAAEAAAAFAAYARRLAAAAPALEEAAAALAAAAGAARGEAEASRAEAEAAAEAHARAPEPGGSAAAAEAADAGSSSSSGGGGGGGGAFGSGQNLGRSGDADARKALASGPGTVIKAGYLGKQARGRRPIRSLAPPIRVVLTHSLCF